MKRLILSLLLLAGLTSLQAQEAFYIYRNDGEFNGFFYDDVKSMRLSKTDLDLTERDEYVVQEIETEDTIYRIPLCAIDSIGFQQPEIIMKKMYDLGDNYTDYDNFPYHYNNVEIYSDNPYALHWERPYYYDGGYKDEELPKKGDILYRNYWCWGTWDSESGKYVGEIPGPFVGKVREIVADPDAPNDGYVLVICDPIENLGEVFEQLITIEQIGWENGSVSSRRFAGEDKVYVRASGNKELTLVNINGTFPLSYGNDDFSATLGIDVALTIKANVSYKVTLSDFNVNVTVKEDAEVGVSFTAKANLGETTTWHLGGMPIYFPSFLPIFQLDPSPEAFIKTAGDLSLKVSTPKFAYHGQQTFHMGLDGVYVRKDKNEGVAPGKEGNGWSMELSLNGSVHGGSNYPIKLETNRWAEKFVYAAIGVDVYSGPKFSASFTLDPVALAADSDVYAAFKNTQIKFSPLAVAFEASGEYSIRNKKPNKKAKWFEGETTFGDITLSLFPSFETTAAGDAYEQVDDYYRPTGYSLVDAVAYPRGNSVPFKVGMAAYNYKKELVSKTYTSTLDKTSHIYSFVNTFDELPYTLPLLSGEYQIVPILDVFGYDVPVWEAAAIVKSELPVKQTSKEDVAVDKHHSEGKFKLQGLMKDDVVEFVMINDSTLVSRSSTRWDDTGSQTYPHVVNEGTQSWEHCGKKVTIEEISVEDADYVLGPEEMGSRTYEYYSELLYYEYNFGSWIYDEQWNQWGLDKGGWVNDKWVGKSGSSNTVSAQEVNFFQVMISRGGHVRKGPILEFVGRMKLRTINGNEI